MAGDDSEKNQYETDGLRSRSARFIAQQRRALNSLLGAPSGEKQGGRGALELASVGTYVMCSSCMLVVNKAAMTALPYPLWVSAMQTAVTALLIFAARAAGKISFPNPTPQKAASWVGILMAWIVPILLNMTAMKLLSVETMMMFRSVATVAVAAADYSFLGTRLTTIKVTACLIISAGGMIYASNDRTYNAEGYVWGAAYGAAMVFNNVYIKHSFNQHKDKNAWEKTLLNNLLATPLIAAGAFWREDSSQLLADVAGLPARGSAIVVLSCLIGFGISMSGTACRDVLTATSFDVLGNCTKYLTLAFSIAFLGSQASWVGIMGVLIALTGGAVYSPAGEYVIRTVTGRRGTAYTW